MAETNINMNAAHPIVIGAADLPLHWGKVPEWLLPIMKRMARAVIDVMLIEWGEDTLLERLGNPFWFQGLSNIIGMDWNSSGSTTVLISILRQVLKPDDGLAVVGGKGRMATATPSELRNLGKEFDLDIEGLIQASKLAARVDSSLLLDGHQLYIHSMIVTRSGRWAVIQQGMNTATRFARRYHWVEPSSFISDPHSAVAGVKGNAANVIEGSQEGTRKLMLDLLNQDPRKLVNDYRKAQSMLRGGIDAWLYGRSFGAVSRNSGIIYYQPISERGIKSMEETAARKPGSLEEALLSGMGASVSRALFLVCDLIYGSPPSLNDPVTHPYDPFKYAYAIGGKDGVPYPVNRRVAEEVINALEEVVLRAKLSEKDRGRAMHELSIMRSAAST